MQRRSWPLVGSSYFTVLLLCWALAPLWAGPAWGAPQAGVPQTTQLPGQDDVPQADENDAGGEHEGDEGGVVKQMHIRSDIQFRYARTVVRCQMKNPSSSKSEQVLFRMTLPSTAFVSNLTVEDQKGRVTVAEVKEKAEAESTYKEAVDSGLSASIVGQEARNSDLVTFKANVKPGDKVWFTLTYEELLRRSNYEYVHSIHLGSLASRAWPPKFNFSIEVLINESLPLAFVKVFEEGATELESNEILPENEDGGLPEKASSSRLSIFRDEDNNSTARILYTPESDRPAIKTSKDSATQKVVVKYDVDRKGPAENQVQVIDGYFVHFFAPDPAALGTLPKTMVFVLDISGSMEGTKLQQVKDAMVTMVDQMSPKDHFSILTFSDDVHVWSPGGKGPEETKEAVAASAVPGTKEMKKEALDYVLGLQSSGGTNINQALLDALDRVKLIRQQESEGSVPGKSKAMILFLTDGQPTVGINVGEVILKNVASANGGGADAVPIYGLAFGEGADFDLVKNVSQGSKGFARLIFEASDAALQLENFYQEISSPLLENVTFEYVGQLPADDGDNTAEARTIFAGTEYIHSGRLDENTNVSVAVRGLGSQGPYEKLVRICPLTFESHSSTSVWRGCIPIPPFPELPEKRRSSEAQNFIERLWAFQTIKSHLKQDDKEKREAALKLALKYNFVTELTSLVVAVAEDDKDPKGAKNKAAPEPLVVAPSFSSQHQEVQRRLVGGLGGPFGFSGYSLMSLPHPKVASFKDAFILGSAPFESFALTTTATAFRTTVGYVLPTSTAAEAGDEDDAEDEPWNGSSGSEEEPNQDCNLDMYSMTYLRGEALSLGTQGNLTEVADFAEHGFANVLTSLQVGGPCCWSIYSEPGFSGDLVEFKGDGKYESASQMGSLFRRANSARLCDSPTNTTTATSPIE